MSDPMPAAEDAPLADGMPMLGLGTWQNDDHEQCAATVATALEVGYRHVDTAQGYWNEAAVGDGIQAAPVDRDAVFLATKVLTGNLGYRDVIESTEESLEKLGTDYVDLLYVHWPAGAYDPEDTLPAFGELYDRGRIAQIGVSNFEPHHVERATEVLDAPVFANQVELHPLLQQSELREYAAETGLELVAYSPLARGGVFDVPELAEIATKHDASEVQVSLAWLREIGVTAIPKATGREHVEENWRSLALDLDDEDLATIGGIDRQDRLVDPEYGPDAWD